ncbi:mate-domain-containing protein [Halteromyces radiatus]|uniref:mate-domain-containing protein n=1 Tax=Halteromyces radiatus TaxID=101107 RepID=UPI00221EB392|nr:mate-domain-containing protein [Halteromyces radiatus]KAI8098782.1 mate-domain-containing protein [Halteromyces radiatus]
MYRSNICSQLEEEGEYSFINHHRGSTSSIATLVDETTPLFSTGIKTSPLLLLENKDPQQHYLGTDSSYFYAMVKKTDYFQETQGLFKFVWPLLTSFLSAMGMKLVDVSFFGKLGPQVLAATSLGNLFLTICGVAFGNGMLTAIDTLVSQAFTGAQHPWTLGIILQRSLIIMGLFSIPVGIIWYHAETILITMGQDPKLASMAQIYLDWTIPVIYPIFITTAIRRFFQCIGKMKVTLYIVLLIFPLNYLVDYTLLQWLDLGMKGAALQNTIYHLMVVTLYSGMLYFGTDFGKKYWPGWSKDACHQWGTFMKLGVPGMLSVSTDWAFEVCAMVTGVLGETSLAAQSIVLSVNTFLLMIPYALSTAVTVRLGHHLGANQPEKAKLCVVISVITGFCLVSFNAMLMFGFRYPITRHFTKDDLVTEAAIALISIVSPCHFVVGNGIILSGVLTAFGKQYLVAIFNLTSYYLVGLPFGIWLTFSYGWGLSGVWSGVVLAGLLKTIGETICLIYYIDWDEECRLAMKRIVDQELPL